MKYSYYYITGFLNRDECEEIISIVETRHQDFRNSLADQPANFKNLDVKVIPGTLLSPYSEKIHQAVHYINREFFGFKLFEQRFRDAFQMNTYDGRKNHNYDWHLDCTFGQSSDIKLTMLLNLSRNAFTGGEFLLPFGNQSEVTEFKSTGCLLVFPAFYAHKVNAVTEGERITLVNWYTGPNLK